MLELKGTLSGESLGLKITSAGRTDVGHVRSSNEDNFKIDQDRNLFVVCDGMGGHQAGEIASSEACNVISYCLSELTSELESDSILAIPAKFPLLGDILIKAIRIANRSVYIKSRSRSDYSGMGTTVVAAVLQNDLVNIAHVGDSRAYRLTDDSLIPLTRDHSWVSELEQSGQYSKEEVAMLANKNVITRALGIHETVEIDFRADSIQKGEIYLLCSDGLCGFVDDGEILSVARNCSGSVEAIVDNLVQMANDRGGTDNVTVVAFRIDEADTGSEPPVVEPVTVPVEGDEAILRENQIIESMAKLKQETQRVAVQADEKSKSGSSFPFLLILIAIIAVALIVYYIFLK